MKILILTFSSISFLLHCESHFVNLDSAKQNPTEVCTQSEEEHSGIEKAEEEDKLGKVGVSVPSHEFVSIERWKEEILIKQYNLLFQSLNRNEFVGKETTPISKNLTDRSIDAYQLGIVSMFKNEERYIKEWIDYHRLAGVEYFWLYDNRSTDKSLEVLQPYIDEGIVEVIDWPLIPPDATDFIATQVFAFRDGIYRARGKAHWIALIDVDEFLLPMLNKNIPECLEDHFPEAAAVFVNWRNFGTGGVYLNDEEPILFRLTAASLETHSNNAIGKSIIRPDKVDIEKMWSPHHCILYPEYDYYNGDGKKLPKSEDIFTDAKHHKKFLRINHYVLRDENFYQKCRYPRSKDKKLLEEHHDSFSKIYDRSIILYLKKYHNDIYHTLWKE